MNTLHRLVLLPLPLLLLCPARAEFNPALVAGDAQWVVSIDLNELRESVLGKELVAMAEKQVQQIQDQMGNVGNAGGLGGMSGAGLPDLRINFQKTFDMIGRMTAYGTNFSSDPKLLDGTLVIEGTPDLKKILEAMTLQGATLTVPDKIKEVKDLPFPAYAIGNDLFIAFPPEAVILASKSRAQLLKGREVVRGAAPSLARTPSSRLSAMLAKANPSYFVAASVAPTDKFFAAEGPQARILQLANSGMIAIGEQDPKTVARVQLVASTEDNADKLLKIVQGTVAMMSLAESTDKQLTEFLQSAVVEKQDRAVSLQMSYASDRLVQMMQRVERQINPPAPAPRGAPAVAAAPANPGRIVAKWSPGKAPAGAPPSAELLAEHVVENVSLVNGSVITLIGQRDGTGAAIFDYVEVLPATGNAKTSPLHFEAENMKLSRYSVRTAPYASRGKIIGLNGSYGTAQFDFPGEDGEYTLHVHYIEQAPGKTNLSVNVKDPDAMPATK